MKKIKLIPLQQEFYKDDFRYVRFLTSEAAYLYIAFTVFQNKTLNIKTETDLHHIEVFTRRVDKDGYELFPADSHFGISAWAFRMDQFQQSINLFHTLKINNL